MSAKLERGQAWLYVGGTDDEKLPHLVLSISDGEVVTWSQPVNRKDVGGFSWLGPVPDFLKQFIPLIA